MNASAVELVTGKVAAVLENQHVSGSELARRIGVSQAYVSRRLTGAVPFDLADLDQVAAALDVPVQRFLAGAA